MKGTLQIMIKNSTIFRFQTIVELIRSFKQMDPGFRVKTNANLGFTIHVIKIYLFVEMHQLAQDFLESVVQYGKIIISERYLPLERKTIKPVDLGGLAGGD